MIKMFLDDIRNPVYLSECGIDKNIDDYIIVRSFYEAIDKIKEIGRIPDIISFDHDLGFDNGNEKNGYDLAKWIIESDMNNEYCIPDNFKYFIHSANPIGKRNIDGIFTSYFKFTKRNNI